MTADYDFAIGVYIIRCGQEEDPRASDTCGEND